MEGMQMKKALMFGLFLGVMLLAVHALTAEAAVDAKAGIAGTVTWTAAAARAEADCSVSEMLVAVGDDIAAGQVVARLKQQDE